MSDPVHGGRQPGFRRHRFLAYEGYAFPWYATLLWLGFFIGGTIYLVRYVLLAP